MGGILFPGSLRFVCDRRYVVITDRQLLYLWFAFKESMDS